MPFRATARLLAYWLDKQIYVVPLAGGTPRAVTSAGSSAWDPYWSKDGSTLYFLSDRSGTSQVWKLPLADFGEAQQVTTFEQGIDRLRFSPDESRLLLGFSDSALQAPAKTEDGKTPSPKPFVITRLEFKEDAGDGYLTGDRTEHLHALDIATGKATQLTAGAYSESDAAWSTDGRQVVFASNREQESDATYRTDLWLVDAGNADKGASLVRLTNDERTKSDPAFSPDGRSIAFLVAEDGVYGAPQVAVMPATGGDARVLTAGLDRWVNEFRYSADGQWIYFTYENLGGNQLARVRPKDGKLETVVAGDRALGDFDVAQGRRGRRAGLERQPGPGDRRIRGRTRAPADCRQPGVPRARRARREGNGQLQESRRHGSPGLRDEAARLRGRAAATRRSCTSTAGRSASSAGGSISSRSTSRRTATSSSSRTRAGPPAAARTSCARSTRPGASPTTTT